MTSWFGSRNPKGPPIAPDQVEAYKEGRDESDAAPDAKLRRGELEDAYARGRREERLRRRRSPLLSFIVLLIVIAAGVLFYLAVRTGSFQSGGAVVDNSISNVSERAQAPVRHGFDKMGNALENAGQNLKQRAGDTPNAPPAAP